MVEGTGNADERIQAQKEAETMKLFKESLDYLSKEQSKFEQERQKRLMRVIEYLLSFQTFESAKQWLLKPNKKCNDFPPIDLINSKFATHILCAILYQEYREFLTKKPPS